MKQYTFSKMLLLVLSIAGVAPTQAQQKPQGIDTSLMDKTISPKNDFFKYVNGTWL